MDQKTLQETIDTLRAVSRVLSAGVVKYPPKMVKEIVDLVEKELGSGVIWFLNKHLPPLEEQLASYFPEEGTKAPLPKISPAMNKLARQVLTDLLEIIEGGVEDDDYIGWFVRTKRGGGKLPDVSKAEAAKLVPSIKSVLKKKKLAEFDDEDVKTYMAALRVASSTRKYKYSQGARKAAFALHRYLEEQEEVAKRAGGKELSPSEQREADKLKARVSDMKELMDYLDSKGIKKSKFKPGPKRSVDHDIKVDLTGIPEKYPQDAVKAGLYDSITLTIMPARSSFAGSWNTDTNQLKIILQQYPLSKRSFQNVLRSVVDTVKHELEHMVQYIIKDSLRLREQGKVGVGPLRKRGPWEEAGTPYKPGRGTRTSPLMSESMEQLRDRYPTATKYELYFLSPIEFFPQIGSAIDRFLSRLREPMYGEPTPEEEIRKNLKDLWRDHSGAGRKTWNVDPFFKALKKYNPKMWKRAVSEGWQRLQRRIDQ